MRERLSPCHITPYVNIRGRRNGKVSETTPYLGGAREEFQKTNLCRRGQALSSDNQAIYRSAISGRAKEECHKELPMWAGQHRGVPAAMPYICAYGRGKGRSLTNHGPCG